MDNMDILMDILIILIQWKPWENSDMDNDKIETMSWSMNWLHENTPWDLRKTSFDRFSSPRIKELDHYTTGIKLIQSVKY
jgi:hypothetical protein